MNNILSIKVDTILKHGTHAKKCAETCTEMRRNEGNLGLHILMIRQILKRSGKHTPYAN